QCVPIDFILPIIDTSERKNNYNVANCLAQSEALMDGYKASGTEKVHPGNRPSNTILFDRVSPEVLGQLISLYEHKVYVQGVIFGINPFDQFGVEYGKKLASKLNEHLIGKKKYNNINKSTQNILDIIENIDSSE
ncbi:MAG: glucose-6-phosphate isomerase, partial [Woeseiaceae bacterium]|nr:glucose-6-phosphate isomerase [Woeseiaceae bacterium]